jgi:hypothetical protein
MRSKSRSSIPKRALATSLQGGPGSVLWPPTRTRKKKQIGINQLCSMRISGSLDDGTISRMSLKLQSLGTQKHNAIFSWSSLQSILKDRNSLLCHHIAWTVHQSLAAFAVMQIQLHVNAFVRSFSLQTNEGAEGHGCQVSHLKYGAGRSSSSGRHWRPSP